MTQTVAKLGVDIVANDKTAKGFASAEKRAGKVGAAAATKMGEAERAAGKLGGFRSAARTFLEVDKAASKAFGSSSALGRISGRVGDFRAVGSAIGSGFGRASVSMNAARASADGAAQAGESAAASLGKAAVAGEAAAGGIAAAGAEAATLGAALGPVGIGLAALVAVGGAAAYAGYKMASGWSYGAAAIGRLSDRIGVAVEDIQKLQLAGERFGIDRGATGGALAGFARTANDAFNARNPEAFVLMRTLGMQFRKKADGTLDYNAMLQDAARGIQAQKDPVIQAQAAERLGLGDMLPLLRQGPDAVRREADDAGAHGAVASGADIEQARRLVHDSTAISQLGERQKMRAGIKATGVALPVLAAALGAGQSLTNASEDPSKRAAMLGAGARKVGAAAERALSAVSNALIAPAEAMGHAGAGMARAADKQDRAGTKMLQAAQAMGGGGLSRYMAGIAQAESGGHANAHAPMGSASGYYQFTDGTWLTQVKKHGAAHGLQWAVDALAHGQAPEGSAMRSRILALRSDKAVSTAIMKDFSDDNAAAIRGTLGHDPTNGERYMAHFLGAGGANRFFSRERANPFAPAAADFPNEARSNRNIFYDKQGAARSYAQVERLIEQRIAVAIEITGLPPGAKATARSGNAVAISHTPTGHR